MLDNKTRIKQSLQSLSKGDFGYQVTNFLNVLGYKSERTHHLRFVTSSEFIKEFPTAQSTQSEKIFLSEVNLVRVLFQLTDTEIDTKQVTLFDEKTFDAGKIKSFIFVAVELSARKYPRGQYALFTREINKRFSMPVVVLFKTSSNLYTVSFAHRRENRRESNRYVLGPISLIREIESKDPHRAHVDILEALMMDARLKWIDNHDTPSNFEGLLNSWLSALNVEELNKKFYCELFAWFLHAVKHSKLPKTNLVSLKPEEHTLRLITRLLFIWFIKQKGLVADDLFNETKIQTLLKNYGQDGDSYYRVILQNLFFATLNTEIDKRCFNNDPNDTSSYHYGHEMKDPEKLQSLFNQTPFINGGLFDFVDYTDTSWRLDCSVNNTDQKQNYSIPNFLFFNEEMGGGGGTSELGLFTILQKYHFTVEENTSLEQEVALDPELLGKVFENLLAAYNPETRETVRNQTGSFYTPRTIVDYMMDESLRAILTDKISKLIKENTQNEMSKNRFIFLEKQIQNLLDYSSSVTDCELDDIERKYVVRAISEIKIIDPAVGSGAFPMAVLNKLTLLLNRVDADNAIWERLQRNMAKKRIQDVFEHEDKELRETQLQYINTVFEKYREDFGRKLCLIQNNIYGVDIQPVAIQIAKLRFFISLAIEQDPTTNSNNNYGIHPLPNLETRFVVADTLIPLTNLDKYTQETLGQTDEVKKLEKLLLNNREQYFHANTSELKSKYKKYDTQLREQFILTLSSENKKAGHLDKIIQWDPYNQNESTNWFDAKYMFGIQNGFDLVIGNPPYISLTNENGKLRKRYQDIGYLTFCSRGDIYQLFFERGCDLLNSDGLLTYITSNSWLKTEYGKKTRNFFVENYTPLWLIELGKDVFKSAIVDSCIFSLSVNDSVNNSSFKAVDISTQTNNVLPLLSTWKQIRLINDSPWCILSDLEQCIVNKIHFKGIPLSNWNITANMGIVTGHNDAFIINTEIKNKLIKNDPKSASIIKPMLRGKDIDRFYPKWANLWLIDIHNGYDDVSAVDIKNYPAIKRHFKQKHLYHKLKNRCDQGNTVFNLRDCAYHEKFKNEKLFWADMTPIGRFAYSNVETYCNSKGYIMAGESLKYLCAVLNSSLIAWYIQNTAATTGMGLTEWTVVTVKRIPIPKIPSIDQRPFVTLVNRIMKVKSDNPDVNTQQLEKKINALVYKLYKLTNDEIRIVEHS